MNRRGNEESIRYEARGRESSGFVKKALIILGFVAAAVLVVVLIISNRGFTGTVIDSSTEILSSAHIIGTDEGFCAYNRDGASGYDDDINVTWNICYNYKDPIGSACGNYYAFADKGGQSAVVTDGTGALSNIEVPGQIRECCVAGNGIVALLADLGEQDYIFLYDRKGTKVLEISTDVRRMGFPITMALSPDGKKLITSYLAIETEPGCRVTFYNFGEVGQNYSDKIVGSYNFENEIIPYISFIDDTFVCVCAERDATIYKFDEVPEVSSTLKYDGTITGIDINDEELAIAVKDSYGKSSVRLYDRTGDLMTQVDSNIEFEQITPDDGELLLNAGNTFAIYDSDGTEKIKTALPIRIDAIFATGKSDEYLVVGDGQAHVVRLIRGEKEEEVEEESTEVEQIQSESEAPEEESDAGTDEEAFVDEELR